MTAPKMGVLRSTCPSRPTAGSPRVSRAAHRDSFHQPLFAHTSPIYVETGKASPERAAAARLFADGIDRDLGSHPYKGQVL